MNFKFKTQLFQTEAVNSICEVFLGQGKQGLSEYSRDLGKRDPTAQVTMFDEVDDGLGYRNAEVELTEQQLLRNIHRLQGENNVKLSEDLDKSLGAASLDVEMETGTGKTYVYIKTMFELHRRFGWSKFIVVVPSVAARESVKSAFEATQDHFTEHYGLKPRFFAYNSSQLHQLDEYSSRVGVNAMIINTQAFAVTPKKGGHGRGGRVIYAARGEFGSRRPLDVLKANRPVIILDEPHKMGAATQNALKHYFNPLFSLNYSTAQKPQG
jgi:type III restriction enzyme